MAFTGTILRFIKYRFITNLFMNARGLDKHLCHLRVEAIEHVNSPKMETMCALFNVATTMPKQTVI
jgi:Mn-dependent DtxR family transcriptional regulator